MHKTISITSIIIKNRFRIFTNWYLYEDNKIAVILILLLLLPVIFFLNQKYRTPQETQIIRTLITLFVPIFISKLYLKSNLKENKFLLNFFDKNKLLATKKNEAILISLIVFGFLVISEVIFRNDTTLSISILLLEVLVLILISFFLPNIITEKEYKTRNTTKNLLWSTNFSNQKSLQVRSIVNREILFLWRVNKNLIFKYVLNVLFINVVFMLFIINNNKEDFFVWAVFLQFIFLLFFILHYPTVNNLKLQKNIPCRSSSILRGEFIFWSAIFTVHLAFILMIYSFFLTEINLLITLVLFVVILFLLAYTLLIRLIYADNIGTRVLVFIMLGIPITIPFTIYNCYKKLKC
ncbi:MAG: hypothetical protein GY936_11645 [Ignavibacteriae bacterium]|nr:hypothetical protein [Ignavibacteriota bacterium]